MEFLDKIKRLRPVSFKWKKEEFPQYRFGDQKEVGLIAQEVEKIFPDLVCDWKDGFKTVRYNHLPIYLLRAIQEQQKIIEELQKKLNG